MSVIIKTSEMAYKDSLGNYHGINAIAEKKIADQIADLDAAITEQEERIEDDLEQMSSDIGDGEDRIDADISQMYSDIDSIEDQRQTMIAAIASVAGQGTDTTLTQYGVAADAQTTGEKISEVASGFGDKADKNDTVLNTTLSRGRKSDSQIGVGSIAFGYDAEASGNYSFAIGNETTALGDGSSAEGFNTIANGQFSHVGGMYNIPDDYSDWSEWTSGTLYAIGDKAKITTVDGVNGYICKESNSDLSFDPEKWIDHKNRMNYVEIIGNGIDENNKSNARTLDWEGNERIMGYLYVNCNPDGSGGTRITNGSGVYCGTQEPTDPSISVWIDPDGNGTLIDDTAGSGDTDKVWSADQVSAEIAKCIAKPMNSGTNGQVLTSDGQGGQSWQTPSSGGGNIDDVQVNGTSVVTNRAANVPLASANDFGVAKISSENGITINSSGQLAINKATAANIKAGTDAYKPIVPSLQGNAVFYGLATAAGDSSQASSSNAVGRYTDGAKTAIQDMLGLYTMSTTACTVNSSAAITSKSNNVIKIGRIVIVFVGAEVTGSIPSGSLLYTVPSGYRPSSETSAIAGYIDRNGTISYIPGNFHVATNGKITNDISTNWSSGGFMATFIYSV